MMFSYPISIKANFVQNRLKQLINLVALENNYKGIHKMRWVL